MEGSFFVPALFLPFSFALFFLLSLFSFPFSGLRQSRRQVVGLSSFSFILFSSFPPYYIFPFWFLEHLRFLDQYPEYDFQFPVCRASEIGDG